MVQRIFLSLLQLMERTAYEAGDSEDRRLQKLLAGWITSIASLILFFLSITYFLMGNRIDALVIFLWAVWLEISFLIFHRRPATFDRIAYFNNSLPLSMTLIFGLVHGGIIESGGAIFFGMVTPFLHTVFGVPLRLILLNLVAYIAILIVVAVTPAFHLFTPLPYPPETLSFLWFTTIINTVVILLSIFLVFLRQRDMYRDRSENLLLNILPRDIADILKQEQRTIADYYESASVLFADVVNFTPMSASMTPVDLVDLLNEVFSTFDLMAETYGVEKIKTIGDCYMVAAGVPRPRSDHAEVLVWMALEMQAYVAEHTFHGQKLAFRIGINSGPVVAGVIGRQKFIYDLWGDAVNTASRMESHGSGGLIQITQETYALIKEHFACESRGIVTIKGKGQMAVWSVLHPLNHTLSPPERGE